MNSPISVTTLNTQIKSLLETTFINIYVEGEISNLTYHNSGHIYFSIKDENSTISCVMFRGNARYLKFQLELGLKIVITGNITVYTPRGNYQLLCTKIEPAGQGALALAYEQLKTKLHAKGYFNQDIKKTLPKYPKKIAIVTSSTGAAIEDMKKVASHRWKLTKLILVPTLVQGLDAKYDIVSSLKYADSLDVDLIILGRGGGSVEDLWAFNEEIVADAIFACKKPVVSAVGHEVDFLISDFVADVRAATPSNAMEIVLPDENEYRIYLDNLQNEFLNRMKNSFLRKKEELNGMVKLFEQNSINSKISLIEKEILFVKNSYKNSLIHLLKSSQSQVDSLKIAFENNNPSKKHMNAYVQVSKNNELVDIEKLKAGDEITLQTPKIIALCEIKSLKNQL